VNVCYSASAALDTGHDSDDSEGIHSNGSSGTLGEGKAGGLVAEDIQTPYDTTFGSTPDDDRNLYNI
jgi:hypothetical protein